MLAIVSDAGPTLSQHWSHININNIHSEIKCMCDFIEWQTRPFVTQYTICRCKPSKHLYNIYTMLDQRRRRWACIYNIQMFCVLIRAAGSALSEPAFTSEARTFRQRWASWLSSVDEFFLLLPSSLFAVFTKHLMMAVLNE